MVRADAAKALGTSGDHRALRHLIAALRDEEPGVQVAAARALGVLGEPGAELPLREIAGDPAGGRWLQETARHSLVQMGFEDGKRGAPAILAWVVGIAVIGASLALAPTIGALAIIGLIAGAAIVIAYYRREMRGSRDGGYGGDGGGDTSRHDEGRGWLGDFFGGAGDGGGGGGNGGS